jgi:hypothetical protein
MGTAISPLDERIPRLSEEVRPSLVVGEGSLGRAAYSGANFDVLTKKLLQHFAQNPNDMGLLLDISVVLQFANRRDDGLIAQREALSRQQIFRVCGTSGPPAEPCLHVLAIMAAGDLMTNTPLEFIFDYIPARLDLVFLLPDTPLPEVIPDHDIAFVAISHSDERAPLIKRLDPLMGQWPRPVVQSPARLLQTSREGIFSLLRTVSGIEVPPVVRVSRDNLEEFRNGATDIRADAQSLSFPLLLRPIDSHAGKSLRKCTDPVEIASYLAETPDLEFYVTQFVDYADGDGMYRKLRIVLIEGRPLLCHMAVADTWMIHYANAGMLQSAEKRLEEARAMAEFDTGFAMRHANAFEEIYRRVGLEYLGIDCGETPNGKLLIFEADAAMVIHAMDPPEIFPYKPRQMQRVFETFYAMLDGAAKSKWPEQNRSIGNAGDTNS